MTTISYEQLNNTLVVILVFTFILLVVTVLALNNNIKQINKLQKDGIVRTKKGTYTFTPLEVKKEPEPVQEPKGDINGGNQN